MRFTRWDESAPHDSKLQTSTCCDAMKSNRPRLLIIPLLAMAMVRCTGPEIPPVWVTIDQVTQVAAAAEEFRALKGRLPASVDEICTIGVKACELSRVVREPRDSWGHPLKLVVSPSGSDYKVLSGGADGIGGTRDDLVFDSAVADRRLRELAGCYRVDGWGTSWNIDRVRLDSARNNYGEFVLDVLSGDVPPGVVPKWYPWGADTVVADFSGLAWGTVILRGQGDTLEGSAEFGGESPWSRTTKARASRVAC